jgi:peptide/nickel transport system substrate-binding protein
MVFKGVLGLVAAASLAMTLLTSSAGMALAQEDAITIAVPSDVPSLDPTLDTSPIGQNVRLNVFDQLTTIAADGSVKPRLATEWTTSPDSMVWTFKLRTDAKFHDGSPVTVDDVMWTYNKIMNDEKSSVRPYLSKIKTMDRISDHELRINLKEPFAPFDRQVSLISIASKNAYEKLGAAGFGQAPIGSGPYKLVRWLKDDRIEMEAFQDYWGGAPAVKKVLLRPIPSDASRASALVSGEADVVPLLPPQLAEGLASREGVNIIKVQSHKVVYIGFDVRNGILGNLDFRRAVDMAIDRKAITEQLLRGLGEPSGQIVAPASFGYDPTIKPTEYDPEKAKELLAKSGYNGEQIVIQYPNNNVASNDAVAQAVAGYLQAIGIKAQLQGMEYTAFFPLWTGRKLNSMHIFSYGPTNLDADLPLTSLYETGRTRGYWENPETDKLVRAQRAEADPKKRLELISKIWKQTKDQVIYSLLYNETHVWGVGNRVTVKPRADGLVRMYEISFKAQ